MQFDRLSRTMDLIICLPLTLILAPVMFLVAAAVRLDGPGPALYRERRVGRGGRPFLLVKFRTLRDHDPHRQRVVPAGDPRVTRTGRYLRRLHLDELPQLFQILAGSMALVGPRPERPELWAGIDRDRRERALRFRPGMTSPASLRFLCEDNVLARYADADTLYREVLFPTKVAEDLRYFEARTPGSDLRVAWRTLVRLLFPGGDTHCRRRVASLLHARGLEPDAGE